MSHSLTSVSLSPKAKRDQSPRTLYDRRRLSQGFPGMDRLALEKFTATLSLQPDETPRLETLLSRLDRLVDLGEGKRIAVVGCGPKPQAIRLLVEKKFKVVGIEPIPLFVASAREYLVDDSLVLEGMAESMPLPDASQDVVFCDSVLEHVVSPVKSLAEMYRVLAPGGIAFITTTNRLRFSAAGRNGEYVYRYFNWLPRLVKECLVFHHLHYDPTLANYSEFPAVHWFTYADLCALGRGAGFAQFYSLIDLLDDSDATIRGSRIKRWMVSRIKYSPWLRALVLTQRGDSIVMLKR